VCQLPARSLTAKFLEQKVLNKKTRELLGDLRRPHSHLLATLDVSGDLQIFDETNKLWLTFNSFSVKQQ